MHLSRLINTSVLNSNQRDLPANVLVLGLEGCIHYKNNNNKKKLTFYDSMSAHMPPIQSDFNINRKATKDLSGMS